MEQTVMDRAKEKIEKIEKKYRSAEFRMKQAYGECVWYQGLMKTFPGDETENMFKEAAQLFADYYHKQENILNGKGLVK